MRPRKEPWGTPALTGYSWRFSSYQTEYFKNRFINESGRVIWDILEIPNTFALSFLVTVDIERVFDSVITASHWKFFEYLDSV